jgi:hypothetical protein
LSLLLPHQTYISHKFALRCERLLLLSCPNWDNSNFSSK